MKDRDTIYLVERESLHTGISSIVGAYSNVEMADDKAAAYNQEFKDKNLTGFFFHVIATTYYE